MLILSFIGFATLYGKVTKAHLPDPIPTPPFHPAMPNGGGAPDGNATGDRHRGFYRSSYEYSGYGGDRHASSGSVGSANRSSAQVILRGAGTGDPGAALPLGFALSVRLVNAILSTDSASPVIAEIPEDVYSHGILVIPAKTRAIGVVRYDDGSRRLQLRFATLVYPEGDQHPIQAIGMMPDGSAGLDGDYHSSMASRQTGRFLEHFVGAMATGMEERESSGPFGMPYEKGSLKNGLLSGVSESAEDDARDATQSLNSAKATMSLPAGQLFLLFLEREYIP